MPFISLIIPVYNAQAYLRRCLDSAAAQSFRDIEVLLVNDGSTDGSLEVCREYENADSRFRVIDKPNTGVADSRNQAIRQARGEYLQFMDSDDWLTENAAQCFAETARKYDCDLVIADFFRVDGAVFTEKQHIQHKGLMTGKEYAAYMMEDPADFYYGVMWNKLYRRRIIEENGLLLEKEISWCEDFIFNLSFIRHAKRFAAVQTPVYYYMKRRGSLASKEWKKPDTLKFKFRLLELYRDLYQELGLYEDNKIKINAFVVAAAKDGGVCLNPLSRKHQILNPENYIEELPPEYVPACQGLGPVYQEDSKILVLGSFTPDQPGADTFYYDSRDNRFWQVLAALTGGEIPESREEKEALLRKNSVALWDVVDRCWKKEGGDGSLRNVIPADLNMVLRKAQIRRIIANGGKAARLYKKYCMKQTGRKIIRCPSTSSANRMFSIERLEAVWKEAFTSGQDADGLPDRERIPSDRRGR